MPKAEEVAEVIVNGQIFRDWKTVVVEKRIDSGFHIFEFTCAERAPLPTKITLLQFKPGDLVTIKLAGIVALVGIITHREVAYDAQNHGVRLIGRSFTWDATRSSIKTTTGNFDGYNFQSIANALLGPFGSSLEVDGAIDGKPFKRCQVMPGEKVYSFLCKLAAHRDITLGAASNGRNFLALGPRSAQTIDTLREGVNILRANCEISDEFVFEKYFSPNQQAGDDSMNMDQVSKMLAEIPGSYQRYAPHIAPAELAGEMYDVMKRVQFEHRWSEGTKINAEITVQGWLRRDDTLWDINTFIMVQSSMLMLNQPLGVRRVRFSQSSDAGTTTMLDMVDPYHLHGIVSWNGERVVVEPKDGPKQVQ